MRKFAYDNSYNIYENQFMIYIFVSSYGPARFQYM